MFLTKRNKRIRRHRRVTSKIFGTVKVPRLSVFRSNKAIYVQLVDDENNKTLFSVNSLKLKAKDVSVKDTKGKDIKLSGKQAISFEVGKEIAKKALENKIEKIVFDRGGYKYHGRVKAVAMGAREEGLKF